MTKENIPKLRVVIDTNILVSALVFGGTPREVTEHIVKRSIRLVMSEEIMSELRRVIHLKFPQHRPGIIKYEKLLRRFAIWVPLGSHAINVSRDPFDNAVLETAVIGKCAYIVSGDKDLLALGRYKEIHILRPAEFLQRI